MRRRERGTVLVLVLGLTAIMLGLVAGVAARVFLSRRETAALHQNAQAFAMLQAARLAIAAHDGAIAAPLTAGDLAPGDLPGRPMADRLGWARIRPDGTPGGFDVVAAGGGSASGGAKTSISAGPALSNAYEIRYAYALRFDPATRGFAIAPRPVLDNGAYPW